MRVREPVPPVPAVPSLAQRMEMGAEMAERENRYRVDREERGSYAGNVPVRVSNVRGGASERGSDPELDPDFEEREGEIEFPRRVLSREEDYRDEEMEMDAPGPSRSPSLSPSVSASASGHGHGHGYSRSWHGHGGGAGALGMSPLGGFSSLGRSPNMGSSSGQGHAQNIPIVSRRDRDTVGMAHSMSSGARSDRVHHGRTDSEGSSGSGSFASHSMSGHGHGHTHSLGHSYSSSHTYATSVSSPGGATRHKHSRSFSGSGFSGIVPASGHSRSGSFHGHHPYARPPVPQGMGDPSGKEKDLPPLPPMPSSATADNGRTRERIRTNGSDGEENPVSMPRYTFPPPQPPPGYEYEGNAGPPARVASTTSRSRNSDEEGMLTDDVSIRVKSEFDSDETEQNALEKRLSRASLGDESDEEERDELEDD